MREMKRHIEPVAAHIDRNFNAIQQGKQIAVFPPGVPSSCPAGLVRSVDAMLQSGLPHAGKILSWLGRNVGVMDSCKVTQRLPIAVDNSPSVQQSGPVLETPLTSENPRIDHDFTVCRRGLPGAHDRPDFGSLK